MWKNPPNLNDPRLVHFLEDLGCLAPQTVLVVPKDGCAENDCHNNVEDFLLYHPACERITGFYVVESIFGYQAVYHSVVKLEDDCLLDITPYTDKRKHIIFAESKNQEINYTIRNKYYLFHDKYAKHESDIMYYVYQLVDPRTDKPFYIGKGNRAQQHLCNISREDNQYKNNKIKSIRDAGFEPEIVIVSEGIQSEELAYDMEETLIKHYGRKGYDTNGILTNVCLNSRPPSHKGKTYEQIYGSKEKAQEQIEKRRKIQIERGGFGPKKHKKETIETLRILNTGKGNAMFGKKHSEETKKKIAKANSKYIGKNNIKSECYKLTSPSGEEYLLWALSSLKSFCEQNNLSFNTFKAALHYKRLEIKKGKAAGWQITKTSNPLLTNIKTESP